MADDRQSTAETFVLCELAGTLYGVRSRFVQQLEMIEHVTPVPNAAPAVEGIVLSRGQAIPALNLRVRFGFERAPFDLRTRLVVVDVDGRSIGLIVDAAREFVAIPGAAIEPPPDAVAGPAEGYLEGIASLGERIVLVLDLPEVVRVSSTEGDPSGP